MKNKEMDKLIAHFDYYLKQNDCTVIHSNGDDNIHIDVLMYPPNDVYPYWKLITMGASDIQMKNVSSLGDRNEYIMFVDKNENMNNLEIVGWYREKLLTVALYPYYEKNGISYGHSIEWEPKENDEMVAAFLEFPQVIEDPSVLKCKLGMFKIAVCLQVVLLTREETDRLLTIGSGEFSNYIYPEDGSEGHFLCERKRNHRF